jgi:hypothetical protein
MIENIFKQENLFYIFIVIVGLVLLSIIPMSLIVVGLLILLYGFVRIVSKRYIYQNSTNILSLIDGVVEAIDTQNNTTTIYCKTNLYRPYKALAPCDANMDIISYQKGANLPPFSYKANLLNEQIKVAFDDIEVKFLSGVCNLPIKHLISMKVSQGDELFVFIDGLAIVTFDNTKYNLKVKIKDKLIAGQTLLCEL